MVVFDKERVRKKYKYCEPCQERYGVPAPLSTYKFVYALHF